MSIVNDALKKVEAKQEPINSKPSVPENKPEGKKEIYNPRPIGKKKNKALYWVIAVIGGVFLIAILASTAMSRADKTSPRSKRSTNIKPANQANRLFGPRVKREAFELTGIMYSEYQPAAIVNNRVVGQGDQIDGATVESIQESLVKLSSEGKEIILQVQ